MQQGAGDSGEPGSGLASLVVGSLVVGLSLGAGFSNRGPWATRPEKAHSTNPVLGLTVRAGADQVEVELRGDPEAPLAIEAWSPPGPGGKPGGLLARIETPKGAVRQASLAGLPAGREILLRVTTPRGASPLVVAGERVQLSRLATLGRLRVVTDPDDPWLARIEGEVDPVAPLGIGLVEAYGRRSDLRTPMPPTGALSRALPVLSPGTGHHLAFWAEGYEVRPSEADLEIPPLAVEPAQPGEGRAADWVLGLAGTVGRLDETRLRFAPFEGPSAGWTRDLPEGAAGVPAMCLDRLVVRGQNGELMGLDVTSGSTVYQVKDLGPLTRDPLPLEPGMVLAVSEKSRLGGVAAAGFDAAWGHLLWPQVGRLPLAAPLAFDPVAGVRAVALVGGEGKLLLLDPRTGRVRPPLAELPGGLSAPPAMSARGDRLVLGGRRGRIRVYDGLESAGPPRLSWEAELGEGPIAGLALLDDGQVLATDQGFVHGLRADGKPAFRTALPAPPAGLPVLHQGRVFVPLAGGGLGVVRASDGEWLERVAGPACERPRLVARGAELYLLEPGQLLRAIRRGPRAILHTNPVAPGGSS